MNPEKTLNIKIGSLEEVPGAAKDILAVAGSRRIITFSGSLGSGKTTIIKAICHILGASDTVTSPSFTIINEYRNPEGEPIYHIDLYRLKNILEAFDAGIEDYLNGDSYCFIEWPELIDQLLPADSLRVRIVPGHGEERIIKFE